MQKAKARQSSPPVGAATRPAEKSQAQRLLEAAKKAKAGGSGFSREMGKATLAMNARKTSKGQVGG